MRCFNFSHLCSNTVSFCCIFVWFCAHRCLAEAMDNTNPQQDDRVSIEASSEPPRIVFGSLETRVTEILSQDDSVPVSSLETLELSKESQEVICFERFVFQV